MTKLQMFIALFGLVCAGCFDPQPQPCLLCRNGSCPPGLSCIEGVCQTHKDECPGPNMDRCDDSCCIDGDCFEMREHMPPESLALWLDWTSLYEGESEPIWSDRSGHAYSFKSGSSSSSPELSSSTDLQRNLLRFERANQYLALSGENDFALADRDFFLLVAGSLSCNPHNTTARPCLVTRFEKEITTKDSDDEDDVEQGTGGMRLCATRAEQPSGIGICPGEGAAARCVSALAAGVACNQMQLFSLSRYTADAPEAMSRVSQLELRHNAVTTAQREVDAQLALDVVSPLRLGGRKSNSMIGDIALVALIAGKVEPAERCRLENFVLQQLAAADMATAAQPTDCSALSPD